MILAREDILIKIRVDGEWAYPRLEKRSTALGKESKRLGKHGGARLGGHRRRLRLRAEAPLGVDSLVWAMDGGHWHDPAAIERWWSSAAGTHRLEVWPAGAPEQATTVRFEVLR